MKYFLFGILIVENSLSINKIVFIVILVGFALLQYFCWLVLMGLWFAKYHQEYQEKFQTIYEVLCKDGYIVYVDGKVVDPDSIDPMDYCSKPLCGDFKEDCPWHLVDNSEGKRMYLFSRENGKK